MIENGMNTSITGRAITKGLLTLEAVNIRDYAFNKHQKVDDYTYGGGAGMLMQAEPVYLAYEAIANRTAKKPISCLWYIMDLVQAHLFCVRSISEKIICRLFMRSRELPSAFPS